MTREELIQKLREIEVNDLDIEGGHVKADQLLLEYINDPEVTTAFNDLEKWYA